MRSSFHSPSPRSRKRQVAITPVSSIPTTWTASPSSSSTSSPGSTPCSSTNTRTRRSIAACISESSRAGRTVTLRRQSAAKPEGSAAGGVPARLRAQLSERVDELDRQREDDRRVLVDTHLEQGLQVAQLEGGRVLGDDVRGLRELLSRLELTLGVDDLGAPLSLGLRLTRHRPLHLLGDL